MSVSDALQNYLQSVMQITGADGTTLCLASELDRQTFFLFHAGSLPPLPELEGVQSASDFYTATTFASVSNVEKEKPIVHCRSSSARGGYLLGIDLQRIRLLSAKKVGATRPNRRRQSLTEHAVDDTEHGVIWLGLRYSDTNKADFVTKHGNNLKEFTAEPPVSADEGLIWTLALGGYMAWEAHRLSLLQQDSISQLPGRIEFQACLRREHEKAVRENHSLGLILVNPDEFGLINHRLGQKTGDAALREVAERLSSNLRRSDHVFRYGGAVFVVIMPTTERSVVNAVAEKLRQTLTKHAYVNGAAHFAFSIGAAVCDDAGEGEMVVGPNELLHRADKALNVAKLSGGARTVCWHPDGIHQGIGNLDRLSGIFTADTEKDYRNMLLLWDTITVISSWFEAEAIAREFVDRVGSVFKPDRVALFVNRKSEKSQLLAANRRQPNSVDRVSDRNELSLSVEQKNLLSDAQEHKRTERLRFENGRAGLVSNGDNRACIAYAIPLLARDECLGSLYLEGPEERLKLDTSDLIFLDALASQIGVALDRAALIYRWKQDKERESQRLRQEVKELRQAIQHSRMVYRSSQMEGLLDTFRKVAPTDVTVLITGESGTGKEMLARTLHDLSARQDKAFVTVDCGAIAQSLMDTELFGHVKGAYTGAQATAPGRITQAEGGTLFLDEIGEVPLEIQTKLLRFLQEKEITPVGGTQPVSIDVRIVAATNRDLAVEVANGRFRGDLYYRLQVVTVIAPPLRQRPDDILPLAEHFLDRFSKDYGKNALVLDQSAETALLEYAWPGNVRELQHRILQAVVMSDKDQIGWGELRLPANATPQVNGQGALSHSQQTVSASATRESVEPALSGNQSGKNPWVELREALKQQVSNVLAVEGAAVPLGRWLADDLVLTADQEANNTASRASSALGMAETTFRRRLEKVKREYQSGLIVRSSDWSAIPPILTNLIVSNDLSTEEKLFDRARSVLLEEVVARVKQDTTRGSALMGVTTPTYRRWTTSLQL